MANVFDCISRMVSTIGMSCCVSAVLKIPCKWRLLFSCVFLPPSPSANVGGVLSICIGCSFISGFEIVYFMLFRLWHNWRREEASP